MVLETIFGEVKAGEAFVFDNKIMKRVEQVQVGTDAFNVRAQNGDAWFFNDTDPVLLVRKD